MLGFDIFTAGSARRRVAAIGTFAQKTFFKCERLLIARTKHGWFRSRTPPVAMCFTVGDVDAKEIENRQWIKAFGGVLNGAVLAWADKFRFHA